MGRLFGTNGVRGLANQDLDAPLALRLGEAVGAYLGPGSAVALAMDARTTSPTLAAAAEAGVLSAGVHVVRLGICPSPAAQFYVKSHEAAGAGIIVTASHNPPEFNGLKLVAADGTEASPEMEAAVEALFFAETRRRAAWDQVGQASADGTANAAYREAVLARVDARAIGQAALTVVVDPAGGPGALAGPQVLEALGCRVVPLHAELDGRFTGRPSEPVERNLGRLMAQVKAEGAHLGVAFDGDADRCIFVDERGRFVSGDVSLAILAEHAVGQAGGGTVCTPVSSSSLVREVVERAGGRVVATSVGSPIVARSMLEEEAIFGGEENGGCIFPKMQHCRDGAMTMAAMLELLVHTGRPLGKIVDALPRFHVVKTSFECPDGQKTDLMAQLTEHFAGAAGLRIETTDGLKLHHEDGSWVLIRPSGTEPIYRVYAESKDAARAQRLAEAAVQQASELLAKAKPA